MHAGCLLIALATVGVETGWQPLDRGGLEYIIQLEPSLLDALRSGESITSEIPLAVRGVRRYRIVVGRDPVPRIGATGLPRSSESAVDAAGPLPGDRPSAAAERAAAPVFNRALPAPPNDDDRAAVDHRVPAPADHRFGGQPDKTVEQPPAILPGKHDPPPAGVTSSDRASGGSRPSGTPTPVGDRYAEPPAFHPPESPSVQPPHNDTRVVPTRMQPDPHSEALTPAAASGPAEPTDTKPAAELPDKPVPHILTPRPWMPLFLTLIALFASLGGNVYLGWVALDSRRHYRRIVRQPLKR